MIDVAKAFPVSAESPVRDSDVDKVTVSPESFSIDSAAAQMIDVAKAFIICTSFISQLKLTAMDSLLISNRPVMDISSSIIYCSSALANWLKKIINCTSCFSRVS